MLVLTESRSFQKEKSTKSEEKHSSVYRNGKALKEPKEPTTKFMCSYLVLCFSLWKRALMTQLFFFTTISDNVRCINDERYNFKKDGIKVDKDS